MQYHTAMPLSQGTCMIISPKMPTAGRVVVVVVVVVAVVLLVLVVVVVVVAVVVVVHVVVVVVVVAVVVVVVVHVTISMVVVVAVVVVVDVCTGKLAKIETKSQSEPAAYMTVAVLHVRAVVAWDGI